MAAIVFQIIASREMSRAEANTRSHGAGVPISRGADDKLVRQIVGRIEIPRVGLSAIVAHGTDAPTLRRAVGHVGGTALPGELGNVCFAGHRDSFFRRLQHVAVLDTIRVATIDSAYDYIVSSVTVVDPDCTAVLQPTPARCLTLITCYPFDFIGSAPERFIVRADQLTPLQRAL